MKSLFVALILSAVSFAFAQEPTPTSSAGADSSDVVGTIQEPSHQNKKIVKKIMTRKEKGADRSANHQKKHHGKKHPAKTEDSSGTK